MSDTVVSKGHKLTHQKPLLKKLLLKGNLKAAKPSAYHRVFVEGICVVIRPDIHRSGKTHGTFQMLISSVCSLAASRLRDKVALLKPMLSTPCESVQICTDPDRYSRICQKLSSQKTVLKLQLID